MCSSPVQMHNMIFHMSNSISLLEPVPASVKANKDTAFYAHLTIYCV